MLVCYVQRRYCKSAGLCEAIVYVKNNIYIYLYNTVSASLYAPSCGIIASALIGYQTTLSAGLVCSSILSSCVITHTRAHTHTYTHSAGSDEPGVAEVLDEDFVDEGVLSQSLNQHHSLCSQLQQDFGDIQCLETKSKTTKLVKEKRRDRAC